MRSSRCSILPLWMQRRFELDAPQRATRILRRSASRAEPQEPESSCPRKRHLSSGPAGHEKRAGRKNGAEGKRHVLSRARTNRRSLRFEVPPLCSFEPLLSSAMRARWDGIPFACLYTSASWTTPTRFRAPKIRLSFRLLSREGEHLSENRGAFHRGNRMTEGIAP